MFHNPQLSDLLMDWREKQGLFADSSYYSITKKGEQNLFEDKAKEQMTLLYDRLKQFQQSYPNYIFALTMGLGKTVLMATCIFYDFLLAQKYPKDPQYCHNALIFAPDKTVLQSLYEIMSLDKSLVVPPAYVNRLDTNVHYHYLMDTNQTSLNTIDGSDFNIIISNTQKIIVKQRHKALKPAEELYSGDSALQLIYGTNGTEQEAFLTENQRFEKLCRLPRLGVFVDEAHHLYGSDLEKSLHSVSETAKTTSLRRTINLIAEKTSVVACYNYTGTPFVGGEPLPEVVYAYGLAESIAHGYLKDVIVTGTSHVKSGDYVHDAVTTFWREYGDKTYENGLKPKMAFFAANQQDDIDELRALVEEEVAALGLPLSSILVNVSDEKKTKDSDLHDFNNLDVPGTAGNDKRFILLVGKGKEGWNCRSLVGVCMYRKPDAKAKNFILQATMRCLRQLSDQQLTAQVFLSEENKEILLEELSSNYNITDLSQLGNPSKKRTYHVRFVPPERVFRMRRPLRRFELVEREEPLALDFGLKDLTDEELHERFGVQRTVVRGLGSLSMQQTEENADALATQQRYSQLMLVAECSRYLHRSCIELEHLLTGSADGMEEILAKVNRYNDILYDIVIPGLIHALYDERTTETTEEFDVVLLKEPPADQPYYTYSADPALVVERESELLKPAEVAKSFHADTYCFDSHPELMLFQQYLKSDKVEKIYFTGMFTANQTNYYIRYFDPEEHKTRSYYPDFLAVMKDGSYQIIEVKGDNKVDDAVVQAKAAAARAIETANDEKFKYVFLKGSEIESKQVI